MLLSSFLMLQRTVFPHQIGACTCTHTPLQHSRPLLWKKTPVLFRVRVRISGVGFKLACSNPFSHLFLAILIPFSRQKTGLHLIRCVCTCLTSIKRHITEEREGDGSLKAFTRMSALWWERKLKQTETLWCGEAIQLYSGAQLRANSKTCKNAFCLDTKQDKPKQKPDWRQDVPKTKRQKTTTTSKEAGLKNVWRRFKSTWMNLSEPLRSVEWSYFRFLCDESRDLKAVFVYF